MGRVQKNKKNAVLIIDSDLGGAEKIKSLIVESDTGFIPSAPRKKPKKLWRKKRWMSSC